MGQLDFKNDNGKSYSRTTLNFTKEDLEGTPCEFFKDCWVRSRAVFSRLTELRTSRRLSKPSQTSETVLRGVYSCVVPSDEKTQHDSLPSSP